ncbi:P1 family peptidase [Myxococcota bacterium]|nr:P1 family peptidase [Myxococcota bacterium]MBU1432805.1 P1 family peptidase [Myxococcota bacterium]MBU1900679.1 P1 family peptidase [Myxococcota bacterium]
MARTRARDHGVMIGDLPTGPYNAITDVEGVLVGHATLISDGDTPARTGVTVIMPNERRIFHERVLGNAFVLNGAGELSGITQVHEWGLIETPIALTNTMSVGTCSRGVVDYMLNRHAEIGDDHDVVIPIVGECDDSWLNDVSGQHIRPGHVQQAINAAASGRVPEGNVGAGTGMITCDLKAGIGTSSRVIEIGDDRFTVGVLVLSNFGTLNQLRVDGLPFGRYLERQGWEEVEKRRVNYGSIICVVATDAPLTPHQLGRIAKRAALGIGRCGSTANHGSGEIVLAFSTKNVVPRSSAVLRYSWDVLADRAINPLYVATIDATEEAILNALFAAETMIGRYGRVAPALPLDLFKQFRAHWP